MKGAKDFISVTLFTRQSIYLHLLKGEYIMGKIVDDRTEEQKKTHTWIVVGTDRFLSGWGGAAGGSSYAGWACEYDHLKHVEYWVKSRSDQMRVRVVCGDYRPKARNCSHFHIYVVKDNHPSLAHFPCYATAQSP